MSNCYVLSGGTLIQNNANLNDFFTPGNYYCPGSVAAQTLINCPCNNAFVMKVELGTGREYPTQTIVEFNTGRRFFRVFVIDTHSWRDWISYITNSDLEVITYDVPKPANDADIAYGTIYSLFCSKSGHLVTLKFNINGSVSTSNKAHVLITLPDLYRPNTEVVCNYISQDGKAMLLNVTIDGSVKLFNLSGETITNGWLCRQTITYITDK